MLLFSVTSIGEFEGSWIDADFYPELHVVILLFYWYNFRKELIWPLEWNFANFSYLNNLKNQMKYIF